MKITENIVTFSSKYPDFKYIIVYHSISYSKEKSKISIYQMNNNTMQFLGKDDTIKSNFFFLSTIFSCNSPTHNALHGQRDYQLEECVCNGCDHIKIALEGGKKKRESNTGETTNGTIYLT